MRVRAGGIDVAFGLEGPQTAPGVALGHCFSVIVTVPTGNCGVTSVRLC
jgi:hypothetical protein